MKTKLLILGVLVALTGAASAVFYLASRPTIQGPLRGYLAAPLSFLKPFWKVHFRERMLTLMSGDDRSYLPLCYECEPTDCTQAFAAALDECLQRHEEEMPLFMVQKGVALGEAVGTCSENLFSERRGSLKPSPACDEGLTRLYKDIGSGTDPRLFQPFMERNPHFEAVLAIDSLVLPQIQEAILAVRAKDLQSFTKLHDSVVKPYLKKAALLASDSESAKNLFLSLLSVGESGECAKVMGLGLEMQKGTSVTPDNLRGMRLPPTAALKAQLIRGLATPLQTPFTPEELELQLGRIFDAKLPPDFRAALEGDNPSIEHRCAFLSALAASYDSLSDKEKDSLARGFIFAMADQ